MKLHWKITSIAGGTTLLVAACTGTAHLKALQPPAVPKSPPIAIPRAAHAHKMQRGIDVDLYTWPGQNVPATAATDVAYIARLHANAVSVSFPFFMNGPNATGVYAGSGTPSPGQVAVLVRSAKRAGLYVSIRPLLDEGSLGQTRVRWVPASPRAWFASYRRLLLPYAAMAQRERVPELIVGTELSWFARSPRWARLDRALRRVYKGRLAFANNGSASRHRLAGNGGPGVVETIDAYHPQPAAHLLAGWTAYDRSLPHGTVETEVGIDAVPGAFRRPYQHQWPTSVIDQSVQARWFTAACRAAGVTHLGGIYFWPVNFGQQFTGPTPGTQGAWAGGAGARAISRCFARLAKTGR